MNRLATAGIYPIVELGPSFQAYSLATGNALSVVNEGIEALYNLIDGIIVDQLQPMAADILVLRTIIEGNTASELNAFRTLPLAPVGKLGGRSSLTGEGFEQVLLEETADPDVVYIA